MQAITRMAYFCSLSFKVFFLFIKNLNWRGSYYYSRYDNYYYSRYKSHHSFPFRRKSCLYFLNYQLIVINEQYPMLSRTKTHFYILNWLVRVTVTALFTLWFDKQTFGFQKYSVACFDK